jgi:choice-of-anchor B domain-containing protein
MRAFLNVGLNSVLAVAVVMGSAFAQSSNSLNVQFLGNKNDYPQTGSAGYSACWGYTAPNGREYALLGTLNGTSIIDITDAPTLREVAFIQGPPSAWREMKTYGQYAYIVTENGTHPLSGVQIVDLSNLPTSATLVKTYVWVDTINGSPVSIPRAHTVSVEGKYLYLNGGNFNGIRILDLSDPLNPKKAGVYNGPYIHDSYIRNDTIYASAINSGGGLDIIDARNKANPQRIKLLQYPGSGTHNAWTTEDGKYVLTTDEIGSTPKSLKIWDIRDIQNPIKVAEFSNSISIVHNVFVKGNLAYVAWYADGLKVIDITNPTYPQLVGFYDTYPGNPVAQYVGAWGAYPYYPSGKVIVSDMQTGLYVLRYIRPTFPPPLAIPTTFMLHQNYPNPFNPTTTIPFDLARETNLRVALFDVLGREIRVLFSGTRSAGRHSIQLDASDLPGGVYLYKLEASDFTQTRRMVLVK